MAKKTVIFPAPLAEYDDAQAGEIKTWLDGTGWASLSNALLEQDVLDNVETLEEAIALLARLAVAVRYLLATRDDLIKSL